MQGTKVYLLYQLGPYEAELIDIFATREAAEREIIIQRATMKPTGLWHNGVQEFTTNMTAAFDIQEKEPRQ